MKCIYCEGRTEIINSREASGGLRKWRRHRCRSCKAIYTTNETVELQSSIRVRKDSLLKPFVYERLFVDMYDCLSHRKTAHTDAKELTDTVLTKLLPSKSGVLDIYEVKDSVLEVLKQFDKAAATYYQAHHR